MKIDRIGRDIKEGRKKKNLSQTKLAELVNSSRDTIYRFEKGYVTNWELLIKIYDILDSTFRVEKHL